MNLEHYGIDYATLEKMYAEWKDGLSSKSALERRYLGTSTQNGKLFSRLVKQYIDNNPEPAPNSGSFNQSSVRRLKAEVRHLEAELSHLKAELCRLESILTSHLIDPATGASHLLDPDPSHPDYRSHQTDAGSR